jgi:hypothetical protein
MLRIQLFGPPMVYDQDQTIPALQKLPEAAALPSRLYHQIKEAPFRTEFQPYGSAILSM